MCVCQLICPPYVVDVFAQYCESILHFYERSAHIIIQVDVSHTAGCGYTCKKADKATYMMGKELEFVHVSSYKLLESSIFLFSSGLFFYLHALAFILTLHLPFIFLSIKHMPITHTLLSREGAFTGCVVSGVPAFAACN